MINPIPLASLSENFTHYATQGDRSTYKADTHLLHKRNQVQFYRTEQKPNGNFLGMAKTSVKVTEDILVPGANSETTLTAPFILELSASYPVGTSDADYDRVVARLRALVADDVILKPLIKQLSID